jgi:hypothetical protein
MTNRFFPFKLISTDRSTASPVLNITGATPALADAIGDDTPIDQQLADAFNSNNAVMAYVLGISNTSLPSVSPEPDWYSTFMTNFADAKIHAMTWTNTIVPNLVGIPTGIANYAFTFNLNMMNIKSALSALQQDPTNQPAKQSLLIGLQTLVEGFSYQLANSSSFQVREIDAFTTNLTADAAMMQAAIVSAQGTVGYDQTQVDGLLADIANLQSEINTWQTVVTAAGIGAGVSFFAGAVTAIFTFGAGLAFGIVGASAGIATLIAAEVKIKQLAAKIGQDQLDMSGLNQQIAALTAMMSQLNTVITLAQAASTQIQLINQAWQVLDQEITTVITDLQNSEHDLSSSDIKALHNDLNSANDDWEGLRRFCLTIAGIQYATATPATVTLNTAQQSQAA